MGLRNGSEQNELQILCALYSPKYLSRLSRIAFNERIDELKRRVQLDQLFNESQTASRAAIAAYQRHPAFPTIFDTIQEFTDAICGLFRICASRNDDNDPHADRCNTKSLRYAKQAWDVVKRPHAKLCDLAGIPSSGQTADDRVSSIPPHAKVAGNQYEIASAALVASGISKPSDKAAYAWLAARQEDLPSSETWSRSVGLYRNLTGTQKNQPRFARGGRSIVQRDEQ